MKIDFFFPISDVSSISLFTLGIGKFLTIILEATTLGFG
jgi:hypothetical protein